MTGIPLAYGTNLRRFGGFPEFRTENLLAESAPSNQEKSLALVGRPGLQPLVTIGEGPLRCISATSGVFDGDVFVLSETTLSRISADNVVTTLTGAIPGAERASMAFGFDADETSQARIANDTSLWLIDGTTVTEEDFPLAGGVSSVAYIRGFWLATASATGEIYTRIPGDTSWDALTFTTAAYKPDKAICVVPVGDQVYIPGEASTEVFALTGDADNPLAQYGGLAWGIGCLARDTAVQVGPTLCMVSVDFGVYQFSPTPALISDPGLSEQIARAATNTFRAWSFTYGGKAYYVLTCSEGTWIWDGSLWTKASSVGYNYWRPTMGTQIGGAIYGADSLGGSGKIWRLNPAALDDDGDAIVRTATAWLEIKSGQLEVGNITVNCATGFAPSTGQGADPLMGVRVSKDGQTWGDWRYCSLGKTGQFKAKARINRWGRFGAPGVLVQVRVSDPTLVRITDVLANAT